jgi:hypothetical protein
VDIAVGIDVVVGVAGDIAAVAVGVGIAGFVGIAAVAVGGIAAVAVVKNIGIDYIAQV